MKKFYWIGLMFVLVLLVSACAQQSPTEVESTAAPAATETVAVAKSPTETSSQPVQEAGEASGAAECRPYNLLDEILAAPDLNLAPITADDHILGPDDAEMTILEFSDFQ
jgi:hypothetical protein